MTTTSSVTAQVRTGAAIPQPGNFLYKTIAIYLNFTEVSAARALLKMNGFADGQISLLGREQENWQNNLKIEWDEHSTAKGTLGGAALGSIPGLILVAGVALTGGVGLLVAGPMAAAMMGLGLGALSGSVMGAVASNVDVKLGELHIKLQDAIGRGQWVIVAHSHDHAEAMRAQELLYNALTVLENEAAGEA